MFDFSAAGLPPLADLGEPEVVEPDGPGGLRRTLNFAELGTTGLGHLNYALAGAQSATQVNQDAQRWTVKQTRGMDRRNADRFDLTLVAISMFYAGDSLDVN